MKTRIVIITSFITTVIVLMIVFVAFSVASPTLAQSLPAQAPSLADAHLALPGGGGGAYVWNLLGAEMTDAYSAEDHGTAFGCIYFNSAYPLTKALATVHLPDGATMTWMRFYWRDWFAQNSEVQLRHYYYSSGIFTYDILATIYSSGTVADPAESYTTTSLNVLVNNYDGFYSVWTDLNFNDDDMKVCGIQIGYTPPSIFGAAMPLIEKE